MELKAMTMANLISKRVAEGTWTLSHPMNRRLSPRANAGIEAVAALDEWEAEGGASAGVPQASELAALRPSALDRLLLQRLGAALVGEWNNLPAPLQRAVYERAAGGGSSLNRLTMRRHMARFLHDHKKPGSA
jgi:hypothetical protein